MFSGIILVHDLTNRKSQQNLRKWLAEILNKDSKETTHEWVSILFCCHWQSGFILSKSKRDADTQNICRYLHCVNCSYDPEQFAGAHTPILVIGTKLDQAQFVRENNQRRSSSIAEECGADEINLVSFGVTSVPNLILHFIPSSSFFWSIFKPKRKPTTCLFAFKDCTQVKHLAPGTGNAVKISRFFDKVGAVSDCTLSAEARRLVDCDNVVSRKLILPRWQPFVSFFQFCFLGFRW